MYLHVEVLGFSRKNPNRAEVEDMEFPGVNEERACENSRNQLK